MRFHIHHRLSTCISKFLFQIILIYLEELHHSHWFYLLMGGQLFVVSGRCSMRLALNCFIFIVIFTCGSMVQSFKLEDAGRFILKSPLTLYCGSLMLCLPPLILFPYYSPLLLLLPYSIAVHFVTNIIHSV